MKALVTRYKDKVHDWEVWNEPNFADNTINTPEMTAEFNIRTAGIIKRIQPQAAISGLALGHFNQRFVDRFFAHVAGKGKLGLFHDMTYHDYSYNPDSNHHEAMLLRAALEKYTRTVTLRQGENGAPSAGGGGRGARRYCHTTDRKLAVFGYRHKTTGKQLYTVWQRDNIPVDSNELSVQEFSITKGDFDQPVWVDIITGGVYEIPSDQWSRKGNTYTFKGIPVYDAPILIADRSLVRITH